MSKQRAPHAHPVRQPSPMVAHYAAPALVAIAGVVAAVPLLGQLPATHDGLHHIFRLFELDRSLRAWQLYPRVFTDMGFGYGFPVLNYYSPLSYYLAWLGTAAGLGYIGGLKLAYVAGLVAAALAMYAWAGTFLPRPGAALAAAAYTFMPYHIADVAVRGALAEATAFVWPPLLLWLVHRFAKERRSADLAFIALAVAAFLLTHNLTAFMFSPVLVLYCVFILGLPRPAQLRAYLCLTAAAVTGAGLSAFYWLPAILEVKYVLAGTVDGLSDLVALLARLDQWVSPYVVHRYTPSQVVEAQHPVSVVQAVLALVGSIGALRAWGRATREAKAAIATVGLTAFACLFLLTPASEPAWRSLTPLHYLQFPWRLQAVIGLGTAAITGYAVLLLPARAWLRWPATFLLAAATATTSLLGLNTEPAHLPTSDTAIGEADISLDGVVDYDFQTALWLRDYGGDWLLEYLPVWALDERETFFLPAASRNDLPPLPAGSVVTVVEDSARRTVLSVSLSEPATLVLHRFYFPGYQAVTPSVTAPGYAIGSLGLLAFDLPAGDYSLTVSLGPTHARAAGQLLTGAALLALALYCIVRPSVAPPATLVGAAAVFLVLVTVRAQRYSTVLRPATVEARLGETVQVVGYSTVRHADSLDVWVYWLSTGTQEADYRSFVHATSASGETVAQHDGQPGSEFSPTSRWLPGEIVADRHTLSTTAEALTLHAGMYTLPDVENLPVTQNGVANPDGRLLLGEVLP